MAVQPIQTLKIFYCYAQEDEALREQLARHLSPLRRLRYITGWYNRDIRAGTDWERESETQLNTANIILLLISADFFASDYSYTVEMQRALAKHRAGTAHVIPILLRSVEWENTPIGKLVALPSNKVPITKWADRDDAWHNVVQGINEVIRNLLSQQQLSAEEDGILSSDQGPLSGQTVGGKYLMGALVGEGGFSQVYKAQHLLVGRQQAVKVLLERHFRKSAFRDRFLREARTVASLNHLHIIHLDDFWVDPSQAYLVMPFVSGGTLQDILDRQEGFLPTDRIVFYLEQISAALDYAHQQGVVHLDLKPLNLLVQQNDHLLLADFGLAHLMKQGGIAGGSSLRIGTPHYMAPEHIQGRPERRSDLFSLGVILYQMLLGRLPFQGLPPETVMFKNIIEWPSAPCGLRPDLPKSVEDMLAKAIAKQPELRYQTANELLQAFKKALEPSPRATAYLQSLHIKAPDALDVQPNPDERLRLENFELFDLVSRMELEWENRRTPGEQLPVLLEFINWTMDELTETYSAKGVVMDDNTLKMLLATNGLLKVGNYEFRVQGNHIDVEHFASLCYEVLYNNIQMSAVFYDEAITVIRRIFNAVLNMINARVADPRERQENQEVWEVMLDQFALERTEWGVGGLKP